MSAGRSGCGPQKVVHLRASVSFQKRVALSNIFFQWLASEFLIAVGFVARHRASQFDSGVLRHFQENGVPEFPGDGVEKNSRMGRAPTLALHRASKAESDRGTSNSMASRLKPKWLASVTPPRHAFCTASAPRIWRRESFPIPRGFALEAVRPFAPCYRA